MNVKTVVVASANPVKVNAALGGLQRMFPDVEFKAVPVSVPSGVADQPMTDEETLEGAMNRVQNAFDANPDADFWIGIEGGVASIGHELAAFAWVVIKSKELLGKARSGTFFLPRAVTELVEQGIELGTADDMVFNHSNSKQKGGAIGILTGNVLDRKELYEQAVVLALVPFRNEQLYAANSANAS
ncbi:non-canonical purine NTP phosphatase [Pontibacter diazotrophicus]|uniref:Probable inosine/xanthosine triphosphatase n=1 Tax=Pontibacter diazotrophicus TaxID=1400979 RepID=A0A3D8LI43_9BACT|nr:inosine/xanthosine triphosphatase [Pontibacter diazotrophicus]RDV16904.1 non-canonical purine NTP phosphatase [Pontibacter diazotrophicus]